MPFRYFRSGKDPKTRLRRSTALYGAEKAIGSLSHRFVEKGFSTRNPNRTGDQPAKIGAAWQNRLFCSYD